MTLTEHLIQLISEMTTVRAIVGRNPTLVDAENIDDQLAIRDGMLLADDPYPGLVIDLQTQEHEKDLLERGGLIHADVAIRAISFSKPEAWALRTAVAFDGGDPNDPNRETGLDGFRDVSGRGIWGIGLRSDTTDNLDPADGEDRVIWIVESLYSVDYREE